MTIGIAPRRGRKRWLVLLVAVSMLTLVVSSTAFATLPSSTFESGDGNLVAGNSGGTHDWNTPVETINCGTTIPNSGTNCGTDLTKSTSDNAFGQGSKEDIENPSVVFGSIPPNKSDLTRFYVNKEKAGGKDFLYLAWERSNILGSANMDFEFNQSRTLDGNGVTPVRTAGDLLVTFDFTNGGGNPVLGLMKWQKGTGANKADCFSANALPCWGAKPTDDALDGINDNRIDLSLAGFAEGAVNTVTVNDSHTPLSNGNGDLPELTFGEAGINLTDSGVLGTGCTHFGAAYLKSRSSASFPAELKDFIAPINIDIANCGALKIAKTSVKGNAPLQGATFSIKSGGTAISGSPFTTNASGIVCVDDLPPGTYAVKEESAPTGYQIDDTTSHNVSVTAGTTCATLSAASISFSDTPLSEIGVTFTSLAGADVTKASIVCVKGANTVSAVSENGSADPAFDDSDETFTSLTPGTYTCTVVVDP